MALFEFIRFLERPVWTAVPQDADRFLAYQRKQLGLSFETASRHASTVNRLGGNESR